MNFFRAMPGLVGNFLEVAAAFGGSLTQKCVYKPTSGEY